MKKIKNIFKKNKKLILKWESALFYDQSIVSAKKFIPKWYKDIPTSYNGIVPESPTVKACIPVLDSLTTGYLITLPYDLLVEHKEGLPVFTFPQTIKKEDGIEQRPFPADENLIPYFHFPLEFTWDLHVSYTLPKGYSALITHPLNRNDLPFTTLSGIIDSGIVMSPHGNLPFYLKKNFTGKIPQGTPVAQIIPFRQEIWHSEEKEGLVELGLRDNIKAQLIFKGWYKKNIWTKKEYN
jgi:hypothetical protein